MHGLFIGGRRPKSKAEVKKIVAETPNRLSLESTSFLTVEFSGPAIDLAEGQSVTFVGPDPYTARKFYGTIAKVKGKLIVK